MIGIGSLAMSHDGTTVAIGGRNGLIELHDLKARRSITTLNAGRTGGIVSMSFSADGHLFAAASERDVVRVWSLVSGYLFKEVDGGKSVGFLGQTHSFAYISKGRIRIASNYDYSVKTLYWSDHLFKYLTVAPHGGMIAGITNEGRVHLISPNHTNHPGLFHTKEKIDICVFSPCGKYLALADDSCTVSVRHIADRSVIKTVRSKHCISCIAYSPCGSCIAFGTYDGQVCVFGIWGYSFGLQYISQEAAVSAITFTSNSQNFITGGADSFITACRVFVNLPQLIMGLLTLGAAPYVTLEVLNFLLADLMESSFERSADDHANCKALVAKIERIHRCIRVNSERQGKI